LSAVTLGFHPYQVGVWTESQWKRLASHRHTSGHTMANKWEEEKPHESRHFLLLAGSLDTSIAWLSRILVRHNPRVER
jgi:hypothetical protein